MANNTTDISHRYLPEDLPFKLQQPIVQLVCGNWHYIALTSMNYVYSWGCNDCGQLGHYNKMEQPSPRLVKALSRRTVCGVAAGSEFSVAVDSEDQVLAWGRADGGLIGIENDSIPLSPVARRSTFSVLAPALVPGLPMHFDQVSIDSTNSQKRELVYGQNLDLPDLSSVGHQKAPYSCEGVLLSLYKLIGLYDPQALTQYVYHTQQWFVLSFCYELQEKWDQAFIHRLKSIHDHFLHTGESQLYLNNVFLVVGDLFNKFEDNLTENFEKDSSIVAMVLCLLHILDNWIKEHFSFQRLEDLLRKHLESLCPLYTIVFYGFLADSFSIKLAHFRFALGKVRKQHETMKYFTNLFHINLLAQVIEQMEVGSSWFHFLTSTESEASVNNQRKMPVTVEESTSTRTEMLEEIIEHKRKILSGKSVITVSNAVSATLAGASIAHRIESSKTDGHGFHSTYINDLRKKQTDSFVFSCGHNLPRYYMIEFVLFEFQSRMSELPDPLWHTADIMIRCYNQYERKMPLACPYCVYNNLRNEQLQVLRRSGVDGTNNRSTVWEI